MTFMECYINVDATSRHCINTDTMLHKCHVLVGGQHAPKIQATKITLTGLLTDVRIALTLITKMLCLLEC